MPRVLNKHTASKEEQASAVYVGRPTKFGNPFSHLPSRLVEKEFMVKTRDEAVSKFEEWVITQPELLARIKKELKGKDLLCYCAPRKCHAEVLLKIANE